MHTYITTQVLALIVGINFWILHSGALGNEEIPDLIIEKSAFSCIERGAWDERATSRISKFPIRLNLTLTGSAESLKLLKQIHDTNSSSVIQCQWTLIDDLLGYIDFAKTYTPAGEILQFTQLGWETLSSETNYRFDWNTTTLKTASMPEGKYEVRISLGKYKLKTSSGSEVLSLEIIK